MKIGINLNPKLMERKVEFKLAEGETPEQLEYAIDAAMKEDIFVKSTSEEGWVHKKSVKMFQWLVIGINHILVRTAPNTRDWFWYHKYLKVYVMHPCLKLLRLLFRKYLITDLDRIPVKPWNNLIRIWRYSKYEALVDVWRIWNMKQHMKKPGYDGCLSKEGQEKWVFEAKSQAYTSRKTFIDFETTLMLMDTADRARIEFEMLHICRTMMEFFDIPKKYIDRIPTPDKYVSYTGGSGNDVEYFVKYRNVKTWNPTNDSTEKKYKQVIKNEKHKCKECQIDQS